MAVAPSRRAFLRTTLAATAALSCAPASRSPRVVVVGAGAFGGWTALYLLRRGARVTLLDAWGPGNSRASSGGETRVIRATYGPDRPYVELVARALDLWREHERRWQRRLLYPIGVLWMVGENDAYERAALPILRSLGLEVEELDAATASRRYPQITFDDVRWALFEPRAGYLAARLACEAVLDAFLAEGGEFRQTWATVEWGAGEVAGLTTSEGHTLTAERYVLACGPWLRTVAPGTVGRHILPTRQEVLYFGTPAGDRSYGEDRLPAWIDNGVQLYYGIPGNRWRGFKLANDARGPEFDPTDGDRTPTPDVVNAARAYLARRFPALRHAPLLEARVCQYENSPDGHYIIDRHPDALNAWVVGGGSGHGFKMGPALGELVAGLVLEDGAAPPLFRLDRLARTHSGAGSGYGEPALAAGASRPTRSDV